MDENELMKWLDGKVLEIEEQVRQANDAYCVICGSDSYPVDDENNPILPGETLDNAEEWHIDHDEDCLISMLDKYRVMRIDENDSY